MSFKRSLRSKLFLLGVCLIVIGLVILLTKKTEIVLAPTISPAPLAFSYAKVTRVYDGDTIQIEGGVKVRYIGIDAPEVYPMRQCYSDEARVANESLVLGKEVKLVKDMSETDRYGRLLRYVYVGDEFINDNLVKNGFVKVMIVPPDTKYKDMFLESEKHARENNLGLWKSCSVIPN